MLLFHFLFLIPFWLLKGRAQLKHELAKRVELDLARIPLDRAFFAYLEKERKAGRELILATASNEAPWYGDGQSDFGQP